MPPKRKYDSEEARIEQRNMRRRLAYQDKARTHREERQQAAEEAFQKRQANIQARAAAKGRNDVIKQLSDTPFDDFTIRHPFQRRISALICDIWAGRDWRGEIDMFATFIREARDENLESGSEEFYIALRIGFGQTERMRMLAKWVGESKQAPDETAGLESSVWVEVERKLERVLRILGTEQSIIINIIQRELKEACS